MSQASCRVGIAVQPLDSEGLQPEGKCPPTTTIGLGSGSLLDGLGEEPHKSSRQRYLASVLTKLALLVADLAAGPAAGKGVALATSLFLHNDLTHDWLDLSVSAKDRGRDWRESEEDDDFDGQQLALFAALGRVFVAAYAPMCSNHVHRSQFFGATSNVGAALPLDRVIDTCERVLRLAKDVVTISGDDTSSAIDVSVWVSTTFD